MLSINVYHGSIQFSCSVVSDSLQPHGLQHARLPCSSLPTPGSLLKLMSIELVMPSNHLILWAGRFCTTEPQGTPTSLLLLLLLSRFSCVRLCATP